MHATRTNLFSDNLTSFRILHFVINDELSQSYHTYKGIPQGSVLSPLLFNLYINKLNKQITHNCRVLQFADDTVLYTRGDKIEEILLNLFESAILLLIYKMLV